MDKPGDRGGLLKRKGAGGPAKIPAPASGMLGKGPAYPGLTVRDGLLLCPGLPQRPVESFEAYHTSFIGVICVMIAWRLWAVKPFF